MILDLERIASDFLRGHAAVAALNTRFVGKTPTNDTGGITSPWVRVLQLDAIKEPRSRPEHLVTYLLQFDIYAAAGDGTGGTSGQPQASLHARTIRAALHDDLPGRQAEAIVTSVRILGHLRNPDTEFKPARERFILTVEIAAH